MAATPFTIGLIQMRCSNDPRESLKHATAMLEEAASKGVQVACLPELFLTHYFCQKEDPEIFNLAEAIPGPTTAALDALAKKTGMSIVGSLFERRASGVYHNTATIHDADGTMKGIYRKMHIPDDPLYYEKYYFTPGDTGFKAFDTKFGRIGTLVCWDQWYPEGARLTAMQGAEVLFYPTAIGWHPAEKAEWEHAQVDQWVTIQRSHAIANRTYVASVNRIGHEVPGRAERGLVSDANAACVAPSGGAAERQPNTGDGIEFFGNSFICDPYGRFLAKGSADKEEILIAEVDPAVTEEARRHWPHFRDRRIDAYAGITKRFGND
jgi:N-carbamoylputrescine amidase